MLNLFLMRLLIQAFLDPVTLVDLMEHFHRYERSTALNGLNSIREIVLNSFQLSVNYSHIGDSQIYSKKNDKGLQQLNIFGNICNSPKLAGILSGRKKEIN